MMFDWRLGFAEVTTKLIYPLLEGHRQQSDYSQRTVEKEMQLIYWYWMVWVISASSPGLRPVAKRARTSEISPSLVIAWAGRL
jgi:hypothetical protein